MCLIKEAHILTKKKKKKEEEEEEAAHMHGEIAVNLVKETHI